VLDYVLSDGISYNLIMKDFSGITRFINIIVIRNHIVRLFANVSEELSLHIMKAKLFNEIIVIRLLQRGFCVHVCGQLSSLLPVFLRASSLASPRACSTSK